MILIGDNCSQLVSKLVSEIPNIHQLTFVSFSTYKTIQERLDNITDLQVVIAEALEKRLNTSLPFWDSFNLSLFNKKFNDFRFLNEVNFHNKKKEIFSILKTSVDEFFSTMQNRGYLTLNSKVILSDGAKKHIPLLDFHIPVSKDNEIIAVQVLKKLQLKGFLLNSGKSYHFYGNFMLEESELMKLLSYALLFCPIIDRAWLAHQLIERSCCLRISKKYSRLPYVIAQIN